MPLAQKKCGGSRTARTTKAIAPSSPTRSIAIAGRRVTKMPAKRIATSRTGAQENSFASRTAAGLARREPGAGEHGEEDRVADEVAHLLTDAENLDRRAVPESRSDDRADHAGEEDDVRCTFEVHGLARGRRRGTHVRRLPAPVMDVVQEIRGEHHGGAEGDLPPEAQRPEERHAVKEAQEERRIAERRQPAADGRH